ncbi:MAG: M20 family peptidase [Candidatus Sericytochromatia bacterium]
MKIPKIILIFIFLSAFNNVEIPNKSVENLSNSIKFQTISYGEKNLNSESEFIKFENFLENTYPLVHKNLKKIKINNSLLYTWQGRNNNLKPIIFLAHLDVVPVENEALKNWTEPPFSGKIKDGFVWGRGTLDDKISVISILEASEKLLTKNFIPERTIYFAFGHDEEIGGENGAKQIASFLDKNKIKAEYILDEGLTITEGIIPKLDKNAALIGVTEKGYASVELSVEVNGGHSSMPDKENSITIISNAIKKINENQMKAKIIPTVKTFFETIGKDMPFMEKIIFSNLWLFEPLVINIFQDSSTGNATLRTTTAITIFKSGIKDNVIPTSASAVVNFRILPTESSENIITHLKKVINDERVKIKFLSEVSEPAPISDITSFGYKVIEKSINKVFKNTIVSPSMVLAGTDSKHYLKISDNIYRFLPIKVKKDDLSRIHGTNERISIDNYFEIIDFYYNLFLDS